jgi:hypothetical protein
MDKHFCDSCGMETRGLEKVSIVNNDKYEGKFYHLCSTCRNSLKNTLEKFEEFRIAENKRLFERMRADTQQLI